MFLFFLNAPAISLDSSILASFQFCPHSTQILTRESPDAVPPSDEQSSCKTFESSLPSTSSHSLSLSEGKSFSSFVDASDDNKKETIQDDSKEQSQ